MVEVFISLGSNIDPERNIKEALRLLSEHIKILQVSTVYLTGPIGKLLRPEFYDCVIRTETDIEPHALKFGVLKEVEERLGRKRSEDRYASRTIDIDILIYGDLLVHTEDLIIPDRDILDRPFLALGLRELKEDLILPDSKKSIQEVSNRFNNEEMTPLTEFTKVLRDLIMTRGKACATGF